MKLMELFSGTGGFAKGLQNAGFNITDHYFSEIDKYAIANYKYNFKNAKYIGSVTDVLGKRGQADIITFGSPCQDFSLAGKRKGMGGERSSLIMEAIRLISEIKPSVFIWENVKGTFSSNDGADFWAILNAFTNIGGYRLEWQLLNTSWFLPQNRERIYLIGHLAERSKPGVFPITETDRGINKGLPKTTNIRTLSAGGHSGGHHSGMTLIKTGAIRGRGEDNNQTLDIRKDENTNTLTSVQKDNVIIKSKTRRGRIGKGVAQTLDTQCNQGVLEKTEIRRLTEIECERLQGFPDDWTKFGDFDGVVKEISRTQRYKMLGNAVTVNVVQEIGKRLSKQCLF